MNDAQKTYGAALWLADRLDIAAYGPPETFNAVPKSLMYCQDQPVDVLGQILAIIVVTHVALPILWPQSLLGL